MADTPYIDNSVVGFDPQSNLRFQVDTYNRLAPIMNLQNQPAFTGNEPSQLRDNFAPPQIEKRQPLPDISIEDAISSKDPSIQQMGRSSMDDWMNKNVPEYNLGLGRTVETPYDQGSKYLNKKYGFSAFRNNEDFYYKNSYMNSSWLGRNLIQNPLRFIGRLVGGTLAKVGESLGYMGSMVTSIGDNNYFEHVADNGFSKWFERQEEWLKNDLIPIYKQAGFDDKGFFSKLGDWSFWNDEVADAGAFMASAMVQTLATDGLGNVTGMGRIGSMGINTESKLGNYGLGKFGRGIDGTVKFLTGADNVAGVANHAFNTASESFFEASGVFKETKQDLLDARQRGENNFTNDQIDRIASQRSASDFKGNLMALTLSNAFENKYIFQPFKRFVKGVQEEGVGALGRVKTMVGAASADAETSLAGEISPYKYSTKVGKFFDWKNPQSRLRFYGSRALASTFIEGLYEENIQLAMERMARYGDYNKKDNVEAILGTLKKSVQQAGEAFKGNDPEAAESIGLGGLIGVLGTGAVGKLFGGKRFFQGERSEEIQRAQEAIDNYNVLRKQFLSFNDIYKKKDDGNYEVDDTGSLVYDDNKVAATAEGLSSTLKKTITADQIENPVSKKLLQDDVLSDFVHASIAAGLETSLVNRIKGLPTKSADEIRALGFNPAEIKSTPEQLVKDVQDLIDIHKESFLSAASRPRGISSKEYSSNEELRKLYLYKSRALALAARNAFLTLDANLTERSASLPQSDQNDSAVNEHNSLTFQLNGLQQFGKMAKQNGSFYNNFIATRKADIIKRQKEIKDSLQDKIDDGILVQQDNLLFTPSVEKSYIDNSLDLNDQQQHATAKNAQLQYEYTANKLASVNSGYQNFQDFKEYQDSLANKDERADSQPHTVKKNDDGSFTVVSPEGQEVQKFNTEEEATQAADELDNVPVDEETPAPPAPTPPEERGVPAEEDNKDLGVDTSKNEPPIDLGVDRVPDETDPDKPVTFWNPNITSKRDTENVSPEEEKLTTDDYSLMRGDFIKRFVDGNPSFSANYKLFIVKDNYPETYQKQTGTPIVKEDNGKWVFTDPTIVGEVVLLKHKDGSVAKVSDFFPDSYKDMGEMPVIFSFDQNVFFGALYNPQRLPIKAEKSKMTIEEAHQENLKWRKEADDAREQVRKGEKDEVEVKLYLSTSGIHPKTKPDSVQKRFGNFSFEVALPAAQGVKEGDVTGSITGKNYGRAFYPGEIIVTIGGESFPAFTNKISEYPEIYSKVQGALSYKFNTLEEAQDVRNNFLDIMVNTNDNQFFTIEKDGNQFVITFRKAREEDLGKGLPSEEIRRNGTPSNTLVGDAALNVSNSGLRNGYKDFDPATGTGEFVTKEDYANMVKPKIMTSLKRVTDKDGNLYMKTVNPYFSFLVVESPETKKLQKNNHDVLKQRIITRISSGQADIDLIMRGLSSELSKGNITEQQYNNLKTLAETYSPPGEGKAADFWTQQFKMLSNNNITKNMFDMAAQLRLRQHPEERATYERMLKEHEQGPIEEPQSPVNPPPAKEEKKSLSDKYKTKDVKNVGDVMREEEKTQPSYVVQDKYVYSPGDNRFSYATSGRKVPDNYLPNILKQMAEKYPYKESAAGNEGFGIFTEDNITIYRPPTSIQSPEIVVVDGKVTSLEEARKQVADNQKLTEFLNRYC